MNNEPVAWMSEFGQFIGKVQDEICHIPLYTHPVSQYQSITNIKIEPTVVSYTHPVKELTIHEDIVYGLAYKYGIEKGDVLDFSRAILRKAQEQ